MSETQPIPNTLKRFSAVLAVVLGTISCSSGLNSLPENRIVSSVSGTNVEVPECSGAYPSSLETAGFVVYQDQEEDPLENRGYSKMPCYIPGFPDLFDSARNVPDFNLDKARKLTCLRQAARMALISIGSEAKC